MPPSDLAEQHAPSFSRADTIRRVWHVAWPLICTNILNVAVGIVDLKMVGMLGVSSIAAVGMARHVTMMLFVLAIAIGGGASVLIAHAYGAKDQSRVSAVATRSIMYMVLGALLIMTPLGLVYAGPMLGMLGGEADVVTLGEGYLRVLFMGSVFTMLNFAVNAVLLGVGKTKVSLVLLIVMNGLNILFNYMLIFGIGPVPAYGVTGAAMGSVASRALGAVAGLWIAFSPRFPVRASLSYLASFDWPLLRQILYLGGPRSGQGIVRNLSRIMTLWVIGQLPDATRAVSAYSVGMQVKMITSFVGLAFMSAAMSCVGQHMGARRPREAEWSGWTAALMALSLMTPLAAMFVLFPDRIMGFFTGDPAVITMGKTFFIIVALSDPIMAFAFALGGALRGGGDPISPFVSSSVSDLVVTIAAGYLLAVRMNMGIAGIALAMAISSVTRAAPIMWQFSRGKWKANELAPRRSRGT